LKRLLALEHPEDALRRLTDGGMPADAFDARYKLVRRRILFNGRRMVVNW